MLDAICPQSCLKQKGEEHRHVFVLQMSKKPVLTTQTLHHGVMTLCQLILHILQTDGPAETDPPAAERLT